MEGDRGAGAWENSGQEEVEERAGSASFKKVGIIYFALKYSHKQEPKI